MKLYLHPVLSKALVSSIFILLMTLFPFVAQAAAALDPSVAADGGIDIGSGGDLVKCKPSPDNKLFGLYSLDYLVFASEEGSSTEDISSWEQSFFSLRRNISEKVPELLKSFDEYSDDVFNASYDRKHVWEPTDYELIELEDEELSLAVKIPENCRQDGKIQLIQAVIRQHEEFSGGKNIIFKYIPEATKTVNEQNPLQLSFLLVHEWLWSVSDNVDRNRRINWYLHSEQFKSDSKEDAQAKLIALGLSLEPPPLIVSKDGDGDFTSLQLALQNAKPHSTIVLKEGTYSLAGSIIEIPIHFRGEGEAEKVRIEGGRSAKAVEIRLSREDLVTFENLQIVRPYDRDAWEDFAAAIEILGGEVHFTNCIFGYTDSETSAMHVFAKSNQSKIIFKDNYFGYSRGEAMILMDQATVEFYNNRFHSMFTEGNKPGDPGSYFSDMLVLKGDLAPRAEFVFKNEFPTRVFFDWTHPKHFCEPDEFVPEHPDYNQESDVSENDCLILDN